MTNGAKAPPSDCSDCAGYTDCRGEVRHQLPVIGKIDFFTEQRKLFLPPGVAATNITAPITFTTHPPATSTDVAYPN